MCRKVGKHKKDPNGTSKAEKYIWGGKKYHYVILIPEQTLAEDKISELEEIAIETIKNKAHRQKEWIKLTDLRDLWDNGKLFNIC